MIIIYFFIFCILVVVFIVQGIASWVQSVNENKKWREYENKRKIAEQERLQRAEQYKKAEEEKLKKEVDSFLDTIGDGLFLQNYPRETQYTQAQLDRIRRSEFVSKSMHIRSFDNNPNYLVVRIRSYSKKCYSVEPDMCDCPDHFNTGRPCKHMYACAPLFFGSNVPESFVSKPQIHGNCFVFIGRFTKMTHDGAKELVKRRGGTVQNKLNRNVDFAVIGTNPGMRLNDAELLGIQTIDEKCFLELLGISDK